MKKTLLALALAAIAATSQAQFFGPPSTPILPPPSVATEPANVQSFGAPVHISTTALSLFDANGRFIGRINGSYVYILFNGGGKPITVKLIYKPGGDFVEPYGTIMPGLVYGNTTCTGNPIGAIQATGYSTRSYRAFMVTAGNLYELGDLVLAGANVSYKDNDYSTYPPQQVCRVPMNSLPDFQYFVIKSGPLNLRNFWKPPFFEQ